MANTPKDGIQRAERPARPVFSRASLTILDPQSTVDETALLSEAALAEDWSRPKEDEAWLHLQPAPTSPYRSLDL